MLVMICGTTTGEVVEAVPEAVAEMMLQSREAQSLPPPAEGGDEWVTRTELRCRRRARMCCRSFSCGLFVGWWCGRRREEEVLEEAEEGSWEVEAEAAEEEELRSCRASSSRLKCRSIKAGSTRRRRRIVYRPRRSRGSARRSHRSGNATHLLPNPLILMIQTPHHPPPNPLTPLPLLSHRPKPRIHSSQRFQPQ